MGNAGSGIPPYVIFRQALAAGDLERVRALAAAMPRVGLEDALPHRPDTAMERLLAVCARTGVTG